MEYMASHWVLFVGIFLACLTVLFLNFALLFKRIFSPDAMPFSTFGRGAVRHVLFGGATSISLILAIIAIVAKVMQANGKL